MAHWEKTQTRTGQLCVWDVVKVAQDLNVREGWLDLCFPSVFSCHSKTAKYMCVFHQHPRHAYYSSQMGFFVGTKMLLVLRMKRI